MSYADGRDLCECGDDIECRYCESCYGCHDPGATDHYDEDDE